MRRTLYIKFVAVYCIIGFLGFLFTATFGSKMVENKLIHQKSEAIYQEAVSVASNNTLRYQTSATNLDSIFEHLKSLSAYQESEIWILNSQNELLIDTNEPAPFVSPQKVKQFDPVAWGSSYYRIGKFYGNFQKNMLSVIAPITANMNVKGYVIIHFPMEQIYQDREEILLVMYIAFLVFFLLMLLILIFFTFNIYRPLQKIVTGVDEFALGHLNYKIPIQSHDEMGYLAASLNYMSDELAHTAETQRNFIANISHDFRSPLTSIKGYLVAIEDGTIPYEMQGRYINIIINETERLEKLTKSLLTLNHLDKTTRVMNFRNFDINKVIKNTIATFEGTCRSKTISIELILTGEQLNVYADMEQIQQVLYNLIDNAIKFSSVNSTITIETTLKNERIFVSVKDKGCGISKENLPKIWDRFYKIDSSRGKDRKGTGLGLAIVKEIINSHHQNINVISTEGVGTEFIFTLERAKE